MPSSDNAPEPLLRATNVHKRFDSVEVLKGIDLDVTQGEVVAIIGSSGVSMGACSSGRSRVTS